MNRRILLLCGLLLYSLSCYRSPAGIGVYGFVEDGTTFMGRTATQWVNILKNRELDDREVAAFRDALLAEPEAGAIVQERLWIAVESCRFVSKLFTLPTLGDLPNSFLEDAILRNFEKRDLNWKTWASIRMQRFGARKPDAARLLQTHIHDPQIQLSVLFSLRSMGSAARDSTSSVGMVLLCPCNHFIGVPAAIALGEIGIREDLAELALLRGLKFGRPFLSGRCAFALGRMAVKEPEVELALKERLAECDEDGQVPIAYALARIADKKEVYIGFLKEIALFGRGKNSSREAARMLVLLAEERSELVEVVVRLLEEGRNSDLVAFDLCDHGKSRAETYLPALLERLCTSKDREVWELVTLLSAIAALIPYAPQAVDTHPEALERIMRLLDHLNENVSWWAIDCLCACGPRASKAVPRLKELRKKWWYNKHRIGRAIAAIEGEKNE